MKEGTAIFIGFAIASTFPALLFGLTTPLTRDEPNLRTIISLFPIGYFFSALATSVFAVPLFFAARRFNLVRWWTAIVGGFVIGAGISVALQWPNWSGPLDLITNIYGATGAVSGLVFWLIWTLGGPE